MAIVLIATEWGTGNGGVNAFNQGLARGLATVQQEPVFCAVTCSSGKAAAEAARAGVELIPVTAAAQSRPGPACGDEVVQWLAERHGGAAVSLWVGHDLITGSAAVAAAERHGGTAALIHHSDYLSYGNIGGGKGAATATKRREQVALFSSPGAAVFGVGPWLSDRAAALAAGQAHLLVPGFPEAQAGFAGEDELRAIVAGRFESKNEGLKRVRLAVEAFGEAVGRSHGLIPVLDHAAMVVLGLDPDMAEGLETLAVQRAKRAVNVVTAPFDPDPRAVVEHLVRSNLAIMPSMHEGFGLIGWEAIGAGVPLILGTGSGLLKGLDELAGLSAEGFVFPVRIDGGSGEREEMASAILKVARDLGKARAKARQLRTILKARHGCTWENAAEQLLSVLGRPAASVRGPRSASAPPGRDGAVKANWLAPSPQNHFFPCAELSLSVGQGGSSRSFELIAELRFGVKEQAHDGIEAEISISRVNVQVTSEQGRIVGERLGDWETPGIEARAGGIWVLTSPERGKRLPNKALGNETLCRIETPTGQLGHARVEVTTAKRDINCAIRSRHRSLRRATERVMAVFLKEALVKQDSGHVVLSVAEVMDSENG